jgi:hypothetical protein
MRDHEAIDHDAMERWRSLQIARRLHLSASNLLTAGNYGLSDNNVVLQ